MKRQLFDLRRTGELFDLRPDGNVVAADPRLGWERMGSGMYRRACRVCGTVFSVSAPTRAQWHRLKSHVCPYHRLLDAAPPLRLRLEP